MEFKHIFEPIKIGPVEIRNRTYFSPCNVHFDEPDGTPGDRCICYYAARAKGGCGLIIYGAILSSRKAAEQQDFPVGNIYSLSHVPPLRDFADTMHYFGAKVFVQLSPGFGRQHGRGEKPCWGASAIPPDRKLSEKNMIKTLKGLYIGPYPGKEHTEIPREMTIKEIQDDVDDLARAAEIAICAGIDGIELHSCHGYLIDQFISPRSNHRTDMYGGSLENRARFLIEIIQKLKQQFGDAVPIMPRISSNHHVPGGCNADEMREVMVMAEQAGADAIELSDSAGFENMRYLLPDEEEIVDTHLIEEQGKKLKAKVKVPVLTPWFHNYEIAEKAVAEGETDMVGSGRQFIADPEFPNKLKAGKPEDIVKCKLDNQCIISIFSEGGCRCSVNPNMGRERFMPEYWPGAFSSKIPESLRRWRVGADEMKRRGWY